MVGFGAPGQQAEQSQLDSAVDWVYRRSRLFPVVTDIAIWPFAMIVATIAKPGSAVFDLWFELGVVSTLATAGGYGLGLWSGVYRQRWRRSSFWEVMTLASIWATTSGVLCIGTFVLRRFNGSLPTSVVVAGSILSLGVMGLSRLGWRMSYEARRRPNVESCRRTIVFGAGEGGDQITRAMLHDPNSEYFPVAILDDDLNKRWREVNGVAVRGTRQDLAEVARRTGAEVLLLAVADANSELIQDLSRMASDTGLTMRVLPPASELVGRMTLSDVRPPTVDDLLGRESVEIDLNLVAEYIKGRRVLITGAGGSIGSELSRQISSLRPSDLFLLDRDENALHGVQLALEGRALLDTDMLVVADIRDRDRVFEVFGMCRPDVVFHTAALKHLTLLENHPMEGVKTNAIGTKNLLDAAVTNGVSRFVNISTDKAADPTSVLGATKLAAERFTAQTAASTGLPYVSVRFGNVLGSRGSVLPTFMEQLERGGPLTVTHPDVTRFFMTIPEAVRLVVQAGGIGLPGEVMVLDMGEPVKIIDLAQSLVDRIRPGTEIIFTGLRPGEKLHEQLFAEQEIGVVRSHPRITHTAGSQEDPEELVKKITTSAGDTHHSWNVHA